jgi:hypothetical protein
MGSAAVPAIEANRADEANPNRDHDDGFHVLFLLTTVYL